MSDLYNKHSLCKFMSSIILEFKLIRFESIVMLFPILTSYSEMVMIRFDIFASIQILWFFLTFSSLPHNYSFISFLLPIKHSFVIKYLYSLHGNFIKFLVQNLSKWDAFSFRNISTTRYKILYYCHDPFHICQLKLCENFKKYQ